MRTFRIPAAVAAVAAAAAVVPSPATAQTNPCTTAPAGPSCQAFLVQTALDTYEAVQPENLIITVDKSLTQARALAHETVRTAEEASEAIGNDTVCRQVFERDDCFNF